MWRCCRCLWSGYLLTASTPGLLRRWSLHHMAGSLFFLACTPLPLLSDSAAVLRLQSRELPLKLDSASSLRSLNASRCPVLYCHRLRLPNFALTLVQPPLHLPRMLAHPAAQLVLRAHLLQLPGHEPASLLISASPFLLALAGLPELRLLSCGSDCCSSLPVQSLGFHPHGLSALLFCTHSAAQAVLSSHAGPLVRLGSSQPTLCAFSQCDRLLPRALLRLLLVQLFPHAALSICFLHSLTVVLKLLSMLIFQPP
mmetsp:Transcript_118932/g.210232  ORF Transcript_118932/g.210232 Transcript_118932/m.210232 type:complete len:255 (-) Transcript_118932:263-1027(-)